MKNRILYIGNNLESKTNYTTTLETLSSFLENEGYTVFKSSSKINKILRMIDMIYAVISKRKKIGIILIDTYSTSNFYYAFIISQIARFLKKKYIPILHGGNLPLRLEKSKTISKLIFNYSYKNIAPSNYLKENFEREGFSVHFIPNTVPIKEYDFKKREEFYPNLLYVRSLSSIYNPKMAINVLNKLKENHPKAKLCFVGPDKENQRKILKDYINELKLEESIEFTGVLTKKAWHRKSKNFDIFINTTNIDNTPISVLEAMALGLPVVSTNVGGLPYLIENNKDGILVAKDDFESMCQEIEKLISNPQKAQEISVKARMKVEKYDWSIVKNDWLKILN